MSNHSLAPWRTCFARYWPTPLVGLRLRGTNITSGQRRLRTGRYNFDALNLLIIALRLFIFLAPMIIVLYFPVHLLYFSKTHTFLLLSIAFVSLLCFRFCKMDKPTPNYPTPDYKTLYPWSPSNLLKETSEFTTRESIVLYRKSESCHKYCIFGREHNKFVRVVPCRVNEHVCCDESSDSEGPFCFIYSTIFTKLFLRLPFVM